MSMNKLLLMLMMVLSFSVVCSSCSEKAPDVAESVLTFQNSERNVEVTLGLSKDEVEKNLSYTLDDKNELEELDKHNGCGTITYYPDDPSNRVTIYYKNYIVARISINNTIPELLSNWKVENKLSIGSTEDEFIAKYGEPLSENKGALEDGRTYFIYYCDSDGNILGKDNREASCTIIATFSNKQLMAYTLVSTAL